MHSLIKTCPVAEDPIETLLVKAVPMLSAVKVLDAVPTSEKMPPASVTENGVSP